MVSLKVQPLAFDGSAWGPLPLLACLLPLLACCPCLLTALACMQTIFSSSMMLQWSLIVFFRQASPCLLALCPALTRFHPQLPTGSRAVPVHHAVPAEFCWLQPAAAGCVDRHRWHSVHRGADVRLVNLVIRYHDSSPMLGLGSCCPGSPPTSPPKTSLSPDL